MTRDNFLPSDNTRVHLNIPPVILEEREELPLNFNSYFGTLTDLGGTPSTDTRTHAQRNQDYWRPLRGASDRAQTRRETGRDVATALNRTVVPAALGALSFSVVPKLAGKAILPSVGAGAISGASGVQAESFFRNQTPASLQDTAIGAGLGSAVGTVFPAVVALRSKHAKRKFANVDKKARESLENEIIPRYEVLIDELNIDPKYKKTLKDNIHQTVKNINETQYTLYHREAPLLPPYKSKTKGWVERGTTVPNINIRQPLNSRLNITHLHEIGHALDEGISLRLSNMPKGYTGVMKRINDRINTLLDEVYPTNNPLLVNTKGSKLYEEKRQINRTLRQTLLQELGVSKENIAVQNKAINNLDTKSMLGFLRKQISNREAYFDDYMNIVGFNFYKNMISKDEYVKKLKKALTNIPLLSIPFHGNSIINKSNYEKQHY